MLEKVINIIYPKVCPICGKTLGSYRQMCKKCEMEIKYIKEPFCKKCGKQLEEEEREYCGDCKRRVHIYDSGIAVFAYNDNIKKSIYDFKYNDMKIYAKFYGEKMWECAREYLKVWQPDAIIPVPISEKRYQKRGYNQAQLIAYELSKRCKITMDDKLLYRRKNTKPLKEISRENRRKNIENAFIINGNVVKYKKVVLVDDIYTTGSTIDECARTLKEHGVSQVFFVALSIGAGV